MTYAQKLGAADAALHRLARKKGVVYPQGLLAGWIVASKAEVRHRV